MRTTLNLDDVLIAEAKILAVRRRTTLTAVIEAALRGALSRETTAAATPLPPAVDGGGLPFDIDLDKSWLAIERLEGSDARP